MNVAISFFCFINALLTAETQRHVFQHPTSIRQQAQANEYLRQRPSRKKRLKALSARLICASLTASVFSPANIPSAHLCQAGANETSFQCRVCKCCFYHCWSRLSRQRKHKAAFFKKTKPRRCFLWGRVSRSAIVKHLKINQMKCFEIFPRRFSNKRVRVPGETRVWENSFTNFYRRTHLLWKLEHRPNFEAPADNTISCEQRSKSIKMASETQTELQSE